jgi:S1-C subfamily serine protease
MPSGRHEGRHAIPHGHQGFASPQPSHLSSVWLWLRARFAVIVGAAALALLSGAAGALIVVELRPAATADGAKDSPALAQPQAGPPGATVEQAAARAMPSVVKLETEIGTQAVEGSGVVLSTDGFILTNNHVVSTPPQAGPAVRTKATLADGRSAPFTTVGADPATDIAVVRVRGLSNLRPIPMGSSTGLRVGQNVIAIGSPLGLDGTVTTGVISALHRPVSGIIGPGSSNAVLDAIQTDATMSPGSSGGALVNTAGALIGLNSAIATMPSAYPGAPAGWIGVGFAIPVDQAMRVAEQLITTGAASNVSMGHR